MQNSQNLLDIAYELQQINTFSLRLDWLLNSNKAQLVGSRFYGIHTDKSDYDFMLLDTDEIYDQVEEYGFHRINHEEMGYHVDICSTGIWRLKYKDNQIDVQLIKDETCWDIKMQTYNLIRDLNMFRDVENKKVRATIFINILKSIYNEEIKKEQ